MLAAERSASALYLVIFLSWVEACHYLSGSPMLTAGYYARVKSVVLVLGPMTCENRYLLRIVRLPASGGGKTLPVHVGQTAFNAISSKLNTDDRGYVLSF